MRDSREWIHNRILLILDSGPCHGYDILRSLNEHVNDLRLTTLYRWLHSMESEGLIISDVQPGPHGPNRRVYKLGTRGETRLREMLKDAIEVIMHFYDAYRQTLTGNIHEILKDNLECPDGRILFTSVPRIKEADVSTIEHLNNGNGTIEILGDTTVISSLGIKHRSLKGEIYDIPAPNDRYAQIWVSGVPDPNELHAAVSEFKRVLMKNGVVRILAPFVYFDEPDEPNIGEFVRLTATQLFPELGMADGHEVGEVLEAVFPDCGAIDVFPGLVVFWARKVIA